MEDVGKVEDNIAEKLKELSIFKGGATDNVKLTALAYRSFLEADKAN